MEELFSDKSKFTKVNFNQKHKVNKELRHLLDMESTIKSFLDDLLSKLSFTRRLQVFKTMW